MSDARLDEFRREVNLSLAAGTLAEFDLPVVGLSGGHPVVVAYDDEPLSLLLARLRAVGGFANVFVRTPGGARLFSVVDKRSALSSERAEDMRAAADRPGAGASVGMFVAYLEAHPEGIVLSTATNASTSQAMARDAKRVELAVA